MDYKHLLKRYMQGVIESEGISFILSGTTILSDKEIDALQDIEREIMTSQTPIQEESDACPEPEQGYNGDSKSQDY